ncbi:MAG: hypothetical protein U1A77_08250 [Pirellulales bacterium]
MKTPTAAYRFPLVWRVFTLKGVRRLTTGLFRNLWSASRRRSWSVVCVGSLALTSIGCVHFPAGDLYCSTAVSYFPMQSALRPSTPPPAVLLRHPHGHEQTQWTAWEGPVYANVNYGVPGPMIPGQVGPPPDAPSPAGPLSPALDRMTSPEMAPMPNSSFREEPLPNPKPNPQGPTTPPDSPPEPMAPSEPTLEGEPTSVYSLSQPLPVEANPPPFPPSPRVLPNNRMTGALSGAAIPAVPNPATQGNTLPGQPQYQAVPQSTSPYPLPPYPSPQNPSSQYSQPQYNHPQNLQPQAMQPPAYAPPSTSPQASANAPAASPFPPAPVYVTPPPVWMYGAPPSLTAPQPAASDGVPVSTANLPQRPSTPYPLGTPTTR